MSERVPFLDVRRESTGWRDQRISERHRAWGFNCPAADVDFLMVEFNLGLPVCLLEYKHAGTKFPDLKHPTYRAISALADAAGLPFALAFYWPETWSFRVYPVNQNSFRHWTDGELLTERQFVQRLYRMRRLALSNELAGKLNDRIHNEAMA